MIEKLNAISTNVWAVALILLGVITAVACMHFKQPLELATGLIGGGMVLIQHGQKSPQ